MTNTDPLADNQKIMIFNALRFIDESINDANIDLDTILDLDNDSSSFDEFCADYRFDAESFSIARKYALTIHRAQFTF